MLVAPLEALCHAEETLVRDAACASANALLRAACTPAQALLHWAPMLLRLCAEGGWFTARVSAAKIFAAVYAGCGARRSAACPSSSLPEPPTAAGRARARARRLRTHKQLASSLTLTLLRHPPPPPSSPPRASLRAAEPAAGSEPTLAALRELLATRLAQDDAPMVRRAAVGAFGQLAAQCVGKAVRAMRPWARASARA